MKQQLETAVLRQYDRALDEEDWPLLELKEAIITHQHRRKKAGQLVDLFEINLDGPFRVKGRLGKLKKDQESIALGPVSKLYKEDMVIPEAYTYSLEIKDDGRIIIWVLGNCAWYALSPAKEYKAIFDEMVEKTKIWLFLEAKYVPSIYKGKKKLKGTVQDVYAEFSRDYPDWPTATEAAALFHKYHEWIILKMLVKETEVDKWARTPIYTEMFSQYKGVVDDVQRILKERNEPVLLTGGDANEAVLYLREEEELLVVKPMPGSQRTSEAATQISQPPSPIMISNPLSQRKNIRGTSKLQKDATPPSLSYPPPATPPPATPLPATPPPATPPPVAIKQDPSVITDDMAVSADDLDDEESSEGETENANPQRLSAKGKSVLRPRTTTFLVEPSSPLAGFGSPNIVDEDEDMADLDLIFDDIKPNNKRYADSDSDDPTATPAERLKKRYRAIQAQPRFSESRSETPALDSKIDWPKLRAGTGKPPIEVGHMPPTTSTRPGGAWACSVPGCRYKILGGDSASGRTLIEEHYKVHSQAMQDAMEIIGLETKTARGIYHVDNLLAKIEQMAQDWSQHRPCEFEDR